MDNTIIRFLLGGCIIVLFSNCQEKIEEFNCPYDKIEWSSKENKTENEKTQAIGFDANGSVKGIFKKLIEGQISSNFETEFKKVNKEIINSSISFNQDFVSNWNALVTDICGKFEIIEKQQLPDSMIISLQTDLYDKVVNFYELTFPKKDKVVNESKTKNYSNKKSKTIKQSQISGRLLDSEGNGISNGNIFGENGESTLTDQNGFFRLEIRKRPQQVKVKVLFSKEEKGEKERYVGVNQTNIILKL